MVTFKLTLNYICDKCKTIRIETCDARTGDVADAKQAADERLEDDGWYVNVTTAICPECE